MPHYDCVICSNDVSYPKADYDFHKSHFWECPSCYCVISNQRYEVNIKGGTTVFSPMGKALGDQILQEVVRRKYLETNPDEDVIFLDEIVSKQDLLDYKPNKVFFANMFSGDKELMPEGSIWFSLCNEVEGYARQGFYSEWQNKESVIGFDKNDNYAVLHLRNIGKVLEKNIEPHYVYLILALIRKHVDTIVLVGNDENSNGLDVNSFDLILSDLPIIDFRNKLGSLGQISWLLEKAKIFIGKDSGIAHLAGASGCRNMVVWGYQTARWFPKVPDGVCDAFTRKDSRIDNILYSIEKRLRNGSC